MNNNVLFKNNIIWYDINENGYIKGCLSNKPAVYIYKGRYGEESCYVGATSRLKNRLTSHRSRINNWNKGYYNNNGLLIFYKSVLEHGWNSFQFGILEYIDTSQYKYNDDIKNVLLKREQYYLDNVNPSMNICKIAGSPLGIKHGTTFSKNLSEAKRGKQNNINKSEIKLKPKNTTLETRLKLSCRSQGIRVKIFDSSNILINEFSSMTSAAKFLGVSDRTVRRVLSTGVSYDNFVYEFDVNSTHPLVVINKENNSIKKYCSLRAAAKDMAVNRYHISNHINTNKLLKGIYLLSKEK